MMIILLLCRGQLKDWMPRLQDHEFMWNDDRLVYEWANKYIQLDQISFFWVHVEGPCLPVSNQIFQFNFWNHSIERFGFFWDQVGQCETFMTSWKNTRTKSSFFLSSCGIGGQPHLGVMLWYSLQCLLYVFHVGQPSSKIICNIP